MALRSSRHDPRWKRCTGLAGTALVASLLAGCALQSTVVIDAAGDASVTQRFTITKSTIPYVTTLDGWEEFVADALNTEDPRLPAPLPSAECTHGEEAELWSYTCTLDAGVEVLSQLGMRAYRINETLYVRMLPSDLEEDHPGYPPLSVSATITVPGDVTSVSGLAEPDSSDTVSFQAQLDGESLATFALTDDEPVTPEVVVTLSGPRRQTGADRSWSMTMDARVREDAELDGQLTAYVCAPRALLSACTEAGEGTVTNGVLTEPLEISVPAGQYSVVAVVDAVDWLTYERGQGAVEVTARSFRTVTPARIEGQLRVGERVRVTTGRVRPEPTGVRYRWLRQMVTSTGETVLVRIPRAEGPTYTVTAADRGYRLVVQAVLSRTGVATRTVSVSSATIN